MDRVIGFILVAVSAAAFGTLAIFGRAAYADGLDTFTILCLRFSLAALVMLALPSVRRAPRPSGPVLLRLIGMGALGYIGQSFAYFTALKYASVGLVALLLYLYPVFVALLAVLFLGERLTRTKGLALALAIAGTTLTAGPAGGQALGVALAIGAAAIYSVYILVGTQVVGQVPAAQSSAVIFAAAGVSAALLMLIDGPHLPGSSQGWLAIGAIVVAATVVPVVTFLAGLERIGPTNAAMLSTLEPVVTVGLAAWWLDERLTPLIAAGGALILAAVLLLTHSELRRAPRVVVGEVSAGD